MRCRRCFACAPAMTPLRLRRWTVPTTCAVDHAPTGEGVVAGVTAVPDKRNGDTGSRSSRRAGAIGGISLPRTASVAVALRGARPLCAVGWLAFVTPRWSRPHPASRFNRIGRGPSKRLQGSRGLARGARVETLRRTGRRVPHLSISPAGECTSAQHLLQDSTLAWARSPGVLDMTLMLSFNRAFRRVVGSPPATWRQAKTSIGPN